MINSLQQTNIYNIRRPVTFKGLTPFNKLPEIAILSGIPSSFTETMVKRIQQFPPHLLDKVKNDEWKIILANNFEDALVHAKIPIELFRESISSLTPDIKRLNAMLLNVHDGIKPIKLVIYPHLPDVINNPGAVNHELCHVIIRTDNLLDDPHVINCFLEDLQKLNPQKMDKIDNYYFSGVIQPTQRGSLDEVTAECIAWQCPGGGVYGNHCLNEPYRPDFVKNYFPKTFNLIKNRYFNK